MTTMKEVAERTGVSVSTVSLVLNDRDEGRVKPAIAEQVRATAKRLGYRPNPLARSLRTSKTRILGFISEKIAATPHAGGIILGAQDAASKLGYMLLTVNTDGSRDEAREIATLNAMGWTGSFTRRCRTVSPTCRNRCTIIHWCSSTPRIAPAGMPASNRMKRSSATTRPSG